MNNSQREIMVKMCRDLWKIKALIEISCEYQSVLELTSRKQEMWQLNTGVTQNTRSLVEIADFIIHCKITQKLSQ